MYCGTYGDGLYRCKGLNGTCEKVGEKILDNYIREVQFSPENSDEIYVGTEPANLYYSSNRGEDFENLSIREVNNSDKWFLPYSPRSGAARTIEIHPEDPDKIYVGVEQGGLMKSNNKGRTWSIESEKIHWDVHEITINPKNKENIYLATGGGVYSTLDEGKTWTREIDDFTRSIIFHPTQPNKLITGPAKRIGKDGRVMFKPGTNEKWIDASKGLRKPMKDMVKEFIIPKQDSNNILMVTSDGRILSSEFLEDFNQISEWKTSFKIDASVRTLNIRKF